MYSKLFVLSLLSVGCAVSATDIVVDPASEFAAAAALPLSPMEPELQRALEAHAAAVYKRLPPMDKLYLEGGTGFTRETAWVVTYNEPHQAPSAVVRLLYGIYGNEALFTVVELDQERIRVEGKTYLHTVNSILYKGKKYRVEQWVDISIYDLPVD